MKNLIKIILVAISLLIATSSKADEITIYNCYRVVNPINNKKMSQRNMIRVTNTRIVIAGETLNISLYVRSITYLKNSVEFEVFSENHTGFVTLEEGKLTIDLFNGNYIFYFGNK